MPHALILAAALAVLAWPTNVCASKFTFSKYTGDPREWPTERESLAEEGTGYAVPVYRTWPSKPYEVLGSIRYQHPWRWWKDSTIKSAARLAKRNGGEAMVIRYGEEVGVTGSVTDAKTQGTRQRKAVTGLVIRFLSDEQIAKREAAEAEKKKQKSAYWQDWEFRHPGASFSEDARDVVVAFLANTGISPVSEEFRAKADDILQRISQRGQAGDLSGEWVCKAHVKAGGIASSTEKDYFGLAKVEQTGPNLTIISTAGNLEMTFTGSTSEKAIAGSLAIAGILSKAEGVAMDEKISLTFVVQLPNGVAQGNVAIQRVSTKKTN